MKVSLIVACDENWGIGKNGNMPWHISEDLKFFSKVTENSCILMGKNTWDSLPRKNKPLANRNHIVLTRSFNLDKKLNTNVKNVYFTDDFDNALKVYDKNIFIIGGSTIYKKILLDYGHLIDKIYLSKIKSNYNCDVFFPKDEFNQFLSNYQNIKETIQLGEVFDKLNQRNVVFEIIKYSIIQLNLYKEIMDAVDPNNTTYQITNINQTKRNLDETGYLNLLKKILEEDKEGRETRNGKTFSVFGPELQFDLSNDTLPLLTTRKMFLRGIFEELIFFFRGETNSKLLEEKGVNIWKGNTSKEFLQSRNLNYPEGYMGPMYGFQWRHFGAEYQVNDQQKSSQEGYDQLYALIQSLTMDPHSRRHLLTTYHPGAVEQSVLAPCHGIVVQFYVQNGNLDCKMYQRSCDTVLGEPFNITSYALMTHLIAWICGFRARKLIISLGDAHIYEQHVEGVKEQLTREPFPFPQLKIKKNLESKTLEERIRFLEDLKFEDLEVIGYQSHPTIKFQMVA
jgi:dihydrofolate reductase/thymidylate synthase